MTKLKNIPFTIKASLSAINIEADSYIDKINMLFVILNKSEIIWHSYNDGIGSYEYWGSKEFDAGKTVYEIESSEDIEFTLSIPGASNLKLTEIFMEIIEHIKDVNYGLERKFDFTNQYGDIIDTELLHLTFSNITFENSDLKTTLTWEQK